MRLAHHDALDASSREAHPNLFLSSLSPMASKKPGGNGSARARETAAAGLAPETLLGESVSGSVLVVDDDEATREMLRYLVTSTGCTAVTAANGLEALEYLGRAASPPCLILLDLMMPVMDGCALDRKLAADARLSLIPVIVITAFRDRAPGLERRLEIIQKPFEIDEVLNFVKRYCR